MMDWLRRIMRTVHDVDRGSNLDLILRGTNGAVNKLADSIRAIAVAIAASSAPADDAAITAATKSLKESTDALKEAVDHAPE
jgi:hypothetical protein